MSADNKVLPTPLEEVDISKVGLRLEEPKTWDFKSGNENIKGSMNLATLTYDGRPFMLSITNLKSSKNGIKEGKGKWREGNLMVNIPPENKDVVERLKQLEAHIRKLCFKHRVHLIGPSAKVIFKPSQEAFVQQCGKLRIMKEEKVKQFFEPPEGDPEAEGTATYWPRCISAKIYLAGNEKKVGDKKVGIPNGVDSKHCDLFDSKGNSYPWNAVDSADLNEVVLHLKEVRYDTNYKFRIEKHFKSVEVNKEPPVQVTTRRRMLMQQAQQAQEDEGASAPPPLDKVAQSSEPPAANQKLSQPVTEKARKTSGRPSKKPGKGIPAGV